MAEKSGTRKSARRQKSKNRYIGPQTVPPAGASFLPVAAKVRFCRLGVPPDRSRPRSPGLWIACLKCRTDGASAPSAFHSKGARWALTTQMARPGASMSSCVVCATELASHLLTCRQSQSYEEIHGNQKRTQKRPRPGGPDKKPSPVNNNLILALLVIGAVLFVVVTVFNNGSEVSLSYSESEGPGRALRPPRPRQKLRSKSPSRMARSNTATSMICGYRPIEQLAKSRTKGDKSAVFTFSTSHSARYGSRTVCSKRRSPSTMLPAQAPGAPT